MRITSLLLLLVFASLIFAQTNNKYVPGQLIIQLKHDQTIDAFKKSYDGSSIKTTKLLSKRMNVWLIEFANTDAALSQSNLQAAEDNNLVKLAQYNHYVQKREAPGFRDNINSPNVVPNDPSFDVQWALNNTGQDGGTPDADIDAVEAWDLSYGGNTALGDEVVIAVIDGGADINHEDISYWKNENEIPNNNIDDDNNGYVDDYDGWNAYSSNGNIGNDSHGTHVAGIAAAIGNNSIGVSGVNPNAKVMPIAGSSSNEAVVVEAYGYVLEMRARYNQTNGTEGAFVVVTNASFGVDYADPADYPIWCAIYDSLGAQGVLNCGATANLNIDIDVQGDVPTACPSDFMVAVTNTTRDDTKNSGAAYGLTTIDLGAPGTSIYNATPGNSYGNKTGTSMATPTVAGAIALMYSGANAALIENYKENPAAVALQIRDFIFDGTDPIAALNGTTVTGGRLNIYNSLLFVVGEPDDVPPTTITDLALNSTTTNSLTLSWTAPEDTSRNGVVAYDIRYSMSPINSDTDFDNAMMLEFDGDPQDAGMQELYLVDDLDASTMYYFAIKSSDIWGNVSELSNVLTGLTWLVPVLTVSPDEINVSLDAPATETETFNIANNQFSPSTLDYEVRFDNNSFPEGAVKMRTIPKMAANAQRATKDNNIGGNGVSFRGAGGPDMFGYEWIDSDETNGPAYNWDDISNTGNEATDWTASSTFDPLDEGYAGPFDIGFDFKFYGETYSEIYVGTNGFLSFSPLNGSTYTNGMIPNAGDLNGGIIAALWDDLDGNGGNLYYQQDDNRFMVQYTNWPEYFGTGTYTFQIVLHKSGKIEIFYNSLTGDLSSATIGIENPAGSDGLSVNHNMEYLHNELLVQIASEPDWLAADNTEGTLASGASVDVELTFTSEDLAPGLYSMDVIVESNDPDNPEVVLPVTMNVGGVVVGDEWMADITVQDNAFAAEENQTLTFGIHPDATDGLDNALGEVELPPLPPAGVFDSRFILPGNEGALKDFRGEFEEVVEWNIYFQPGTDGYPMSLFWEPNDLPEGTFSLVDAFGGTVINVNMKNESFIEVTNTGITSLKIVHTKLVSMDMAVNEGWNIIAVPMLTDDMTVTGMFPDATSNAFGYNNGYEVHDTLKASKGYWLKFPEAGNHQMTGSPVDEPIVLHEGWNLIGCFESAANINSLYSEPAGLVSSSYFGFNNGYSTATELVPGHGYWVKSSGEGMLYYGNVAKRSEDANAINLDNFSKLIVTDAEGKTSTLYLSQSATGELYDMPPIPPAGSFDVRFNSNKFAESFSNSGISISGATFPVSIESPDVDVQIATENGDKILVRKGKSERVSDSRINVSKVDIPNDFTLTQNYPNPFNPTTTLKFGLPVNAKVVLDIYNVLGEKVSTLIQKDLEAGIHTTTFNAVNLPSGIYFYNITATGEAGQNFSQTKKMLLVK